MKILIFHRFSDFCIHFLPVLPVRTGPGREKVRPGLKLPGSGRTGSSPGPTVVPNPNDGSFQIKLNNIMENDFLQLYNALGQLVYEEKIMNANLLNVKTELGQGIYYLRFKNTYSGQALKVVVQ